MAGFWRVVASCVLVERVAARGDAGNSALVVGSGTRGLR